MKVHKQTTTLNWGQVAAIFVGFITFVAVSAYLIAHDPRANATNTQLGTPQVTLNPGGGILSDGTDGLRFTINSDSVTSPTHQYDFAYFAGQDALVYRATYQYCCSAGGPMLNIGGTLYGQSGPAYSATDWDSIEVISTAGAASVGARTSNTGNSAATIRYKATKNEMQYTVDRTVTYAYPNDFVTDNYSFTIPVGNEEEVKFYLGGDTAPGSSDQGYGIMLTSPVRSVISLNPYSHIMFGLREVQGSRPFDGATSQQYGTPYATVQAGGDIGFVGTPYNHDAGLMMQWNLGSTPGTYSGKFQQFATQQGTNLNAAFAEPFVDPGDPVDLNISIVNSELDPVEGLGYTLNLPAGLVIDSSATSDCGGTLTATLGSGTVSLSGVDVAGASNCVVTVPVSAEFAGAYRVDAASVTDLAGSLTNNLGVSILNVGVYTLSFATQGGTSVNDQAVEAGDQIELPTTTRSGFAFLGWNTAADGSGDSYNAGDDFTMPLTETVLYARWQQLPTISTLNPADDATGVPVGVGTLQFNFDNYDEYMVADSGAIGIYKASDDSLVQGMFVDDTDHVYDAEGTFVIVLDQDLEPGTEYYVSITDHAFKDGTSSRHFPGILDKTTWNFTTAVAMPDPVITTGNVTNITENSARVSGTVQLNNGFTINDLVDYEDMDGYGLYLFTSFDTVEDYDWYDAPYVIADREDMQSIAGDDTHVSFRTTLTGLTCNTTYYYENSWEYYQPDSDDWDRADDIRSFTTSACPPVDDEDGIDAEEEGGAPNEGDGNNDGVADSEQAYVTSLVNPVTSEYSVLDVSDECTLGGVSVENSADLLSDDGYSYPVGLFNFTATCGASSTTVTQYYYNPPTGTFTLRKFDGEAYRTVSDASISRQTIGGQSVLVISYTVEDGGELDADGEVNGVIVDPAGPALLSSDSDGIVPNTGLARESTASYIVAATIGAIMLAIGVLVIRKKAHDVHKKD